MFSYLPLVSKCSFFIFIRVGEISSWGVFFDITKIITNFTGGISSPKYKSKYMRMAMPLSTTTRFTMCGSAHSIQAMSQSLNLLRSL